MVDICVLLTVTRFGSDLLCVNVECNFCVISCNYQLVCSDDSVFVSEHRLYCSIDEVREVRDIAVFSELGPGTR